MTAIYLTFSLPFAVWLMVSYFEDVPPEMEEAALLDRAGRLRALWHVILPQVRGGIAVTTIFVFLNAWNEFLFAVVLARQSRAAGDRGDVQFHFGRADAVGTAGRRCDARDGAGDRARAAAQRHIVKGLTVGAVKGGGRR